MSTVIRNPARSEWFIPILIIAVIAAGVFLFLSHQINSQAKYQNNRIAQQDKQVHSVEDAYAKLQGEYSAATGKPAPGPSPSSLAQQTSAIRGDRGATGTPGLTGLQGPIGLPGIQGLMGLMGLPGANGTPGASGAAGANGTPGASGSAGANGAPGLSGVQGLRGLQGLQGAMGLTGLPGLQGLAGLQGIQGPSGPAGAAGATGATVSPYPFNFGFTTTGQSHQCTIMSSTVYTCTNKIP